VIKDKYVHGASVGPFFRALMKAKRQKILDKDDDAVVVIVGGTGVGKSNLGLWIQDIVTERPTIQQVALTREDLAKSFDIARKDEKPNRYVQYDEGKLNRRDWNSSWSKELLEIYHDIRGKNIFHVWCTAFPDLLDRVFIKERISALIYCYDKGTEKNKGMPRRFYYFTKEDLIRFLEKNDSLSMPLLKKFSKAHASLQSYYMQYKGPMADAYLVKKENRMDERIDAFVVRWGSGDLSCKEAATKIGVADSTVRKWLDKVGTEGEHFIVTAAGPRKVTPEGLTLLEEISRQKRAQGVYASETEVLRSLSHPTYDNARTEKIAKKQPPVGDGFIEVS
jgi:transposase